MLVGFLRTKHIVDAYSVSCDCLSFLSLSGADRVQVENVDGGGSGAGGGEAVIWVRVLCVLYFLEKWPNSHTWLEGRSQ